jgi:tetratricopeptide (TPR) repeat protein
LAGNAFDCILRGTAVTSAPKTRKTYAEAISLFDRALALDSRTVEAQSFLAIHLAGRVTADVTDTAAADMARAEALAGQAVAASPRSALAYMGQAMLLRAQDRFNEAIRAYDAVLTLNRNFVPHTPISPMRSSPPVDGGRNPAPRRSHPAQSP